LGHNIPDALDAAYEEIDLECKHKYKKDTIWMSNVGDTRAVLCHRSRPIRLSYDHKAKDEAERQRVLEEGGSFGDAPEFRLMGVLSVTRAFGDADCGNYLRATPFISEHKLHPDDDYLVMASDGLWDVFTDADVVRFINDEIEVRGNTDPQRWAKLLADEAMKLESKDNISIVIIVLNERNVIELSKSPVVLDKRKRHLALSPRSSSPTISKSLEDYPNAQVPPNFVLKFRKEKEKEKESPKSPKKKEKSTGSPSKRDGRDSKPNSSRGRNDD